jgi:hypothetical protein
LLRRKITAVTAQEREQAAIPGAAGIQLPPQGKEMMIDQANDVKAVGHDQSFGEVLLHHSPVTGGQIHADHLHLFFALKFLKVGFQSRFRSPQHHIVDFVVLQIAEGSGKAFAAGEEVLVNAQNLRAVRRMPLSKLEL